MAPSATTIRTMFSSLSSPETAPQFFAHVSPTVSWTIIGDTPMSGTYTTLQSFIDSTLTVLRERVLTAPLRIEVVNVIAGEGEWASVELKAVDGQRCRDGMAYEMRYCWCMRFEEGEDGKERIVEVRAYLDTDLLRRAMERNP